MDEIRCPKCLEMNDADKLAENTEYGCWSGSEVPVYCLNCEFQFDVSCEHAGYNPESDFDVYAFMRAHKTVLPEGIDRNLVSYYLRELVEDDATDLRQSEKFPELNEKWEAAYWFSKQEWSRIKSELGRL